MLRTSVFISYSHQDEGWKNKLIQHLSQLLQKEALDIWEDRQIQAGDSWEIEITKAIDKAAIAILLISEPFLKSSFISQKEVPAILNRQASEGLRVIPILLHECNWTEINWLSALQLRPADGIPLSSYGEEEQKNSIAKISEEITALRAEQVSHFRQKLLRYLKTVKYNSEKLPAYFPKDAQLTNIRTRVRVSKKGVMDSQFSAKYREHILQSPPSDGSLYRYRMDAQGMRLIDRKNAPSQEDSKIQHWDSDIRNKLKRGVIVGDPGFGKSWLLRWEAITLANEAIKSIEEQAELDQIVIPVSIRLFDLSVVLEEVIHSQKGHLAEAVCQLVADLVLVPDQEASTIQTDPEFLAFLRKGIGTKNVVLLLDALDEVPKGSAHTTLLKALDQWVQKSFEARVLLTSRHANYQAPWKGIPQTVQEQEMELLPFNSEQIAAFIKVWFGEKVSTAIQMEKLIRESPQLKGLAELPLLLGFLCALFDFEHQGKANLLLDGKSINAVSRSRLYQAIVESLLFRIWDQPHQESENLLPQEELSILRDRTFILQELAFHFFIKEKVQFSQSELSTKLVKIISGNSENKDKGSLKKQGQKIIKELSQDHGILIEGGKLEAFNLQFLFLHLTIHEYLCAAFLSYIINQNGWENATLPETDSLIKDLIVCKSWDRRWEQVILLLSGMLDDPEPLLIELLRQEQDDLFCHSKALTSHCLGEAWLRFSEPGADQQLSIVRKLATFRDQLSTELFDQWYFHQKNNSYTLIPHLVSAFPPLIRMDGKIRKVPIIKNLIKLIKKDDRISIKNAAVNLLVKSKNELISDSKNIKGIFEIFQTSKDNDVKVKLMDVLEEISVPLFETDYIADILTDFIEKAPPKIIFSFSNFFLFFIHYSKQQLSDFEIIRGDFEKKPGPQLRLKMINLLKKSKGTFVYFLFNDKISSKEVGNYKAAMQLIEEPIQTLQKSDIINSFKIEESDQAAIDLIEEAVAIQKQMDNSDPEKFMEVLETFEIEGEKLKDLLFSNDEDLKPVMENKEVMQAFATIFQKIMQQGGIWSLPKAVQDPQHFAGHTSSLLDAFITLLKTNNSALKISILEAITNFSEDFDQYELNEEEVQVFETRWTELKKIILEMVQTEEEKEVIDALTATYLQLTSSSDDAKNNLLVVKQSYEEGGKDELVDYYKGFFAKIGVPIADNDVFINAYLKAVINIDPDKFSSNEEFQQLIFNDHGLVDTLLNLYTELQSPTKKAAVISLLGFQNVNVHQYETAISCLENGLSTGNTEIIYACIEASKKIGKSIINSEAIIQFLIKGLQDPEDETLIRKSAQAVRTLADIDSETYFKHETIVFQIVEVLLSVYLHTQDSSTRYSVALSLFALCKTRFRLFPRAMPSKLPKWLNNVLNRKTIQYEIKTLKSLSEWQTYQDQSLAK